MTDHTSLIARLESAGEGKTFQDRCGDWLTACFGADGLGDVPHRNRRFLEEAGELVQGAGMPEDEAIAVVRYVYARPAGEVSQEVGGVLMTLAAHCIATGNDMLAAGEKELARVWTKVDVIRAKEAAKPSFQAPQPNPPEKVESLVERAGRQIDLGRRTGADGGGKMPSNIYVIAAELVARIHALEAQVAGMGEALNLAANRFTRLALETDLGTSLQYDADDWSRDARAAAKEPS